MRLRGRKGILEELEKQPELVVLEPGKHRGKWRAFFGNDRPIHVELGMGKGIFISKMSAKYPEINFIGVDRYDELVRRASDKARKEWKEQHDEAPRNLALVRYNIEFLEEMFEPSEIDRIFLNFSDPWPKAKHARRRLTHPRFLEKYKTALNDNGEIHMKTDSVSLFEYSLNMFADCGLRMRNISLNLHADGPHPDHVMTEYEAKFSSRGMPIHRCEVVIGSRALEAHERSLHDELARQRNIPAERQEDIEADQ